MDYKGEGGSREMYSSFKGECGYLQGVATHIRAVFIDLRLGSRYFVSAKARSQVIDLLAVVHTSRCLVLNVF